MSQLPISSLGIPRFEPYLLECSGDTGKAQRLYMWNIEASAAAYAALHGTEIVLRNAIDGVLRDWNEQQGYGRDWLFTPDPRLRKLVDPMGKTLSQALQRAEKAVGTKRDPHHNDVLAQMTMGTWRFLLPSNRSIPKRRLWNDALHYAFPNWHGDDWQPLVTAVDDIYILRNRIAHLEPIFKVPLRKRHNQIKLILRGIGQTPWRWYNSYQQLTAVERVRPTDD